MANLTNPVASTASYSMIKSNRNLRGEGQKLATGSKGTSDIVDYVVGSKLQTSATVLRGVSKGATYGYRMFGVAQNTLISVKTTLVNLRNIIAQANTATGDTLKQLDALYRQGVLDTMRLLSSAEFDGRKLFDGSLVKASATAATAASEGIPSTGAPLDIRVGELMDNTIQSSLPRIMSGTGLNSDATGATLVADTKVEGRFTPLFPILVGNAELGAVHAVAHAGDPDTTDNAVQALPEVANESAFNVIVRNFAKSVSASTKGKYDADADGALAHWQNLVTTTATIASAGHLLDSTAQTTADSVISKAIDTVTAQISSIGGQMQILQQASDDIESLINVQQESAGDYLNTNYESSATEFKSELLKLQGSIRIILQGFDVAEAALELVR